MTPEQALADLVEISSQVRAAVLVSAAGEVEAATDGGEALAGAARQLLDAAAAVRPAGADQPVTQLEAATRGGSVFVVSTGGRTIAAATAPSPTVGLVFYDLKTCLRSLSADEDGEPERGKTKAAAKAKADPEPERRATKATRAQAGGDDETT
jgi:hypothetical protein